MRLLEMTETIKNGSYDNRYIDMQEIFEQIDSV